MGNVVWNALLDQAPAGDVVWALFPCGKTALTRRFAVGFHYVTSDSLCEPQPLAWLPVEEPDVDDEEVDTIRVMDPVQDDDWRIVERCRPPMCGRKREIVYDIGRWTGAGWATHDSAFPELEWAVERLNILRAAYANRRVVSSEEIAAIEEGLDD